LILAFFECEISAAELKNLDAFQAAAAKANLVLSIPNWEQTPDALNASIMKAIAKATRRSIRSVCRIWNTQRSKAA